MKNALSVEIPLAPCQFGRYVVAGALFRCSAR